MQRSSLGMAVVWWTLLGMVLAAEQQPPAVPGAARREAPRVFVQYCSACHGVHGRGDGPAAPALQPPPADLTRITQRHDGLFLVTALTAVIDGQTVIPAHGSREMPIWGVRFGERGGGGPAGKAVVHDVLRLLIDYLQAIQQ
jgi:mono/diheme cytochrome c family protein